jgi:hypothetical protein
LHAAKRRLFQKYFPMHATNTIRTALRRQAPP